MNNNGTKRPLGDITNLKRNDMDTNYKIESFKSKMSESFVSSTTTTKATDLIRKSLSARQSISWKMTPKKLHVQIQTDSIPLESTKEIPKSDQQESSSLYDWEVETIDEVKEALKETLKENEMVR